jgi:hypothetical protein
MLRKIYISALQPDAGRRLMWITPGATRGMETIPHCREMRSSSTRYGVVGERLLRHPGLHRGYPPWTPSGVNLQRTKSPA